MSGVSINFDSINTGWAHITLRAGGQSYVFSGASYTTDALGDLVRAALMIATGAYSTRFSFDSEPMEWRVILTSLFDQCIATGSISIDILTFADISAHAPDDAGNRQFRADCPALDFARAALACARAIEADYEWATYPFPETAVRALEAALA